MAIKKHHAGFTLVELAIVLVIIGLLVGGVLVGQDLIKAAEIRAVSSDLQKYDTGAAAFRTKYTGIPGDLAASKANSFGLTAMVSGTDGLGDGDGILENNAVDAAKSGLGGENLLFWRHLSQAQFIPFGSNYTSGAAIDATGAAMVADYAETMDPVAPKLRIRDIGYVHAGGVTGLNYYFVAAFNTAGTAGGLINTSDTLSPREALGIDQKIDDGNAARGVVLSHNGTTASAAPAGGADAAVMSGLAAGDCYNTGVTTATLAGQYNTGTESLANSLGCALRIRTQF